MFIGAIAIAADGHLEWQDCHFANENIVLIGDQHFDASVHQVCEHLQEMATIYSPRHILDTSGESNDQ